MKDSVPAGHMAALFSVCVWGVTYVCTKFLLEDFEPTEILLIRFVLGFSLLCVLCPHVFKVGDKKREALFVLAGLCGVCLYYLLENIALTYTMASNVGVIGAIIPFFTAIIAHFIFREKERFGSGFVVGLVISMVGIVMIALNGQSMHINPLGDMLALLAVVVWAIYSVILRKISEYGYNTVQVTRRCFLYGIIFMVPIALISGFDVSMDELLRPDNLAYLLFLGLVASGMCFATWSYAVGRIGAVKSSVYIYLDPVIVVVTAAIFLGENITLMALAGTALTLAGLLISQFVDVVKTRSALAIWPTASMRNWHP